MSASLSGERGELPALSALPVGEEAEEGDAEGDEEGEAEEREGEESVLQLGVELSDWVGLGVEVGLSGDAGSGWGGCGGAGELLVWAGASFSSPASSVGVRGA